MKRTSNSEVEVCTSTSGLRPGLGKVSRNLRLSPTAASNKGRGPASGQCHESQSKQSQGQATGQEWDTEVLGSVSPCIDLARNSRGDLKHKTVRGKKEILADINFLGIQSHSKEGSSFVLEKGSLARLLRAGQLKPEAKWVAQVGGEL